MSLFRRRPKAEMPMLNTAALPDLIFTVLFFFMFVTHMRVVDANADVKVPKGQDLEKVSRRSSTITLFVTADGRVMADGKVMKADDVADYIVAERRKMSPETVRDIMVNIKADKDAKMNTLNSIRSQLRNINVLNVSYSATEEKAAGMANERK